MTAERPEWQELRDRHGQDWIEPTPANLQWLSDQGYAHLAELIALLQAELVVVRERAERLEHQRDNWERITRDRTADQARLIKRIAELEARLGRAAAVVTAARNYAHGRGSHQSLLDALTKFDAVLVEQEKQP